MNVVLGVCYICKAIGEIGVDKNFQLAMTDFLKGLGEFGISQSITTAMQAPPGHISSEFKPENK